MLEYMVNFFVSGFFYPGLPWTLLLLGIGIALVFGAIWFLPYWTPLLKKPWAWAVIITSVILTWAAAAFIQIPLQLLTGQALGHFWSQEILIRWLLLAGIPQILLSGLVQEGSKLVPVVVYWWKQGRNIDPRLGLAIGAVAGAGFGVYEAVWAHNTIFAGGWTWAVVQQSGAMALFPFWERFSTVAFHTASCALAGYGLARGWGWQFYLLASCLHGLLNYAAVLLKAGVLNVTQVEIYVMVIALLLTAAVLWIRWRKPTTSPEI